MTAKKSILKEAASLTEQIERIEKSAWQRINRVLMDVEKKTGRALRLPEDGEPVPESTDERIEELRRLTVIIRKGTPPMKTRRNIPPSSTLRRLLFDLGKLVHRRYGFKNLCDFREWAEEFFQKGWDHAQE